MKSKDISNLLVGQDKKPRNRNNGFAPDNEPVNKPASLLDDTFSDSRKKTNWKTPIWIAGLVIIASLLTMFFVGADRPGKGSMGQSAEPSRNPELLEKLVSEAKDTGEEEKPAAGEPANGSKKIPGSTSTANRASNESGAPPQDIRRAENRSVATPPSETTRNSPAARSTEVTSPPASASSSNPAGEAASQEPERPANMPELIREVPSEATGKADEETNEEVSTGFDRQQKAFDYLENNAPVAGKLIRGGYGNLNYSGWKVIRETDQEIWIDIEATWDTGGPAIHHIWSVDVENDTVKALSQAARNLEALRN